MTTVRFYNFGNTTQVSFTEEILSVTRPSVTAQVIVENNKYKTGPLTWDDITLRVEDDSNHTSKLFNEQFSIQLNDPTAKFEMSIVSEHEEWVGKNCSILNSFKDNQVAHLSITAEYFEQKVLTTVI